MREPTKGELEILARARGQAQPKSQIATWSVCMGLILGAFGLGTLLMVALANGSDPQDLATLFLVVCGVLFYFVPAYVAHKNQHHNFDAIFLLNIFLGWTFVGWVVALVWATTKRPPVTPQ